MIWNRPTVTKPGGLGNDNPATAIKLVLETVSWNLTGLNNSPRFTPSKLSPGYGCCICAMVLLGKVGTATFKEGA